MIHLKKNPQIMMYLNNNEKKYSIFDYMQQQIKNSYIIFSVMKYTELSDNINYIIYTYVINVNLKYNKHSLKYLKNLSISYFVN